MGARGFSLVELVVVVAIVSTLLAIGTLQFNQYTKKAGIEGEVRAMYADLMKARSEALLQKKNRSVTVSAAQFSIYTSLNGTGTAPQQTALKYGITYDSAYPNTFCFDSRGLASVYDATTGQPVPGIEKMVCVTPAGTAANVDSILITTTMIQMGKWNGSCDSGHFTAK